MSQGTSSEKIKFLHNKVHSLLKQNFTNEQIIEELKKENLEQYYIETIIENIKHEKTNNKNFWNSMIMGGFYIVSGLAINFFSYRFSENSNSSGFYLFWGIVVFGIVTIIRGFILYRK